jgi:hypothetical protein
MNLSLVSLELFVDLYAHFIVQYLFDSENDITVLQCGHTLHLDCLHEMHVHAQ